MNEFYECFGRLYVKDGKGYLQIPDGLLFKEGEQYLFKIHRRKALKILAIQIKRLERRLESYHVMKSSIPSTIPQVLIKLKGYLKQNSFFDDSKERKKRLMKLGKLPSALREMTDDEIIEHFDNWVHTDVWHQQVKDWLGSYFCHEILPITPRRKDARGSVLMNPCVLNDFLANPAAVGIFQKMFSSSLPAFKILLLNSDFSSKFLGTIISLDF